MSPCRVLYWFRTDLRIHDSPALKAALDLKPECLYPVWCWDPHYVRYARVGPNRLRFLLDCHQDLSCSLTKLNPKQKLLVLREAATTLLPKLFKEWQITHLVFEKDTDSYAASRDAEVVKLAKTAGVSVVAKVGRTLWDPELITQKNGGKPTMTYASLVNAGKKIGTPAEPVAAPESLPEPGDISLSFNDVEFSDEFDLNQTHRSSKDDSFSALGGPDGNFSIPTLEELGMSASAAVTPHRGGESEALKSLTSLLQDKDFIATFSKPQTAPTAFRPASTTLLSPHFHFGSLSVRYFLREVEAVLSSYQGKKKETTEPTNLRGQLCFRDMYFAAQHAIGSNYSRVENNPEVRYIPWHLSSTIPSTPSSSPYVIDSPLAHRYFLRWAWGLTGFPFIDALMRQLRSEGWIHHLGRHMVACFLTRGGCYVSWERGAEVFEQLLLDHEVACNAGNWMWLSCTAFYSQYYRCYSPVAFGKKWDKSGAFIRKYVPELAAFPDKWIYEPHMAPPEAQRRAGCAVRELDESVLPDDGVAYASVPSPPADLFPPRGENGEVVYPAPMFDFAHRREVCMAKMKQAYSVGLRGNDERVLKGQTDIISDLFGGLKTPEEEGAETVKLKAPKTKGAGAKRQAEASSGRGRLDGWHKKSKVA